MSALAIKTTTQKHLCLKSLKELLFKRRDLVKLNWDNVTSVILPSHPKSSVSSPQEDSVFFFSLLCYRRSKAKSHHQICPSVLCLLAVSATSQCCPVLKGVSAWPSPSSAAAHWWGSLLLISLSFVTLVYPLWSSLDLKDVVLFSFAISPKMCFLFFNILKS